MPRFSKTKKIIPPLPAAIRLIATLSDEQFATLRAEVNSQHGYSATSSRCKELYQKLSITSLSLTEIEGLLASLEFLYDRARAWSENKDERSEVLNSILVATDLPDRLGDDYQKAFDRVILLTQENSYIETDYKRTWLRTGILNNAKSFASFVDLRPNFDETRSSISELIPIVIFEIESESQTGDSQSHVFQMTEESLEILKNAIDDTIGKLRCLNSNEALQKMISKEKEG